MKIADILFQARQVLDAKGVSNSKLDSLILLSHALFLLGENFSKEKIIFNPDLELNEEQQKSFLALIARRAKREPVSHIIGKREFFGEDFLVNSAVLDPRPDSETLIETVLKKFPNQNQQLKVLELGVGSGCLIVTLLKSYKLAQAMAVDISKAAIEVAQKNSITHQVQDRLQIIESDLFQTLNGGQTFDLIISNPPYIESKAIDLLQPEVKIYEPRTALDGGLDGLDFYRRIANNAKKFLSENGQIILEIGYGQESEIEKIFLENNFIFESANRDLAGILRVMSFKK